jgi:hypothetical protein
MREKLTLNKLYRFRHESKVVAWGSVDRELKKILGFNAFFALMNTLNVSRLADEFDIDDIISTARSCREVNGVMLDKLKEYLRG